MVRLQEREHNRDRPTLLALRSQDGDFAVLMCSMGAFAAPPPKSVHPPSRCTSSPTCSDEWSFAPACVQGMPLSEVAPLMMTHPERGATQWCTLALCEALSA
jgi:hypothetical protein